MFLTQIISDVTYLPSRFFSCINLWGLSVVFIVNFEHINRQPHKMIKHTQTIRQQKQMNCFSVFDNFVGLTLFMFKILQTV